MKLPGMKYTDGISKGMQVKFAGLNRSAGTRDGELRDMRNLTSDHAPLLAVRPRRMKYKTLDDPGGLFEWEGLAWVSGTGFYFDGILRGQVTEGRKSFASLGAWIVIFPDKCCYNVETGVFRPMESVWSGGSLTFGDGVLYGEAAKANCIQCQGVAWADWFSAGDAVTIAGCTTHPGNNRSIIIRAMDEDKLYFYENSFTLTDGAEYTENGDMRITREVPELEHLCQNENRLWGCTKSTIYASKLGDIFNWNVYDGLDTDSYAVDSGSAGNFTGCISYLGYPTFFKENNIYKVYGSVPSNFEVMGSATLGLAEGAAQSIAIAGESLFYLSRSGVMAYTGGVPQPMGADFGNKRFKNGVGGTDGLKYYVSMEDEKGDWGLYVYDTQNGMWHQEDESQAIGFARWEGNLYMLNTQGELWILGQAQNPPQEATAEAEVVWMAEFADFTEEDPNRKGVSKIQIRMELEEGASMTVWLMADSDGIWHQAGKAIGEKGKKSYYLPIVPRRMDHFRLKLSGQGGCRVYSMVRERYSGSER